MRFENIFPITSVTFTRSNIPIQLKTANPNGRDEGIFHFNKEALSKLGFDVTPETIWKQLHVTFEIAEPGTSPSPDLVIMGPFESRTEIIPSEFPGQGPHEKTTRLVCVESSYEGGVMCPYPLPYYKFAVSLREDQWHKFTKEAVAKSNALKISLAIR